LPFVRLAARILVRKAINNAQRRAKMALADISSRSTIPQITSYSK
jgi:hypothetical protein